MPIFEERNQILTNSELFKKRHRTEVSGTQSESSPQSSQGMDNLLHVPHPIQFNMEYYYSAILLGMGSRKKGKVWSFAIPGGGGRQGY